MDSLFDKVDPTVFRSYAFWCSVLVIKMLAMSVLTGMTRRRKLAVANPDDAHMIKGAKVNLNDPDVERVRRAHLNDLENILPFFVIGFMYMLTGPSVTIATNLFRIVAIARIVHTLVYAVVVVPQPARGLAFGVAAAATTFMAVQTMFVFL